MSKLTPYFAPAGSICAKVLPDCDLELFLPFFSSHLMLPLKPGEVVWVLYPEEEQAVDISIPGEMEGSSQDSKILQGGLSNILPEIRGLRGRKGKRQLFKKAVVVEVLTTHMSIDTFDRTAEDSPFPYKKTAPSAGGYWFSRVAGTRLSEDLNFCHLDRDNDIRATRVLSGKPHEDVLGSRGVYVPGFPNGITAALPSDAEIDSEDLGRKEGTYTLGDTPGAYEEIQKGKPVNREPVPPAFKSQPGDFVINGSNNTRISLGSSHTFSPAYSDDPVVTVEDGEGINSSTGEIILSVGSGLSGGPLLTPAQTIIPGVWEQEKCPELNKELEDDAGLVDNWMTLLAGGEPAAAITITSSGNPEGYISFEDGNPTFKSTIINAEDILKPISSHQIKPDALAPISFKENVHFEGSVINGQADHIRFGARESLRIGSDGGAEIILHRDGNVFIKPGPTGHVFIGGGPSEAYSQDADPLLDTDDEGVAVWCDMVTYPSADPALGLAGEMAMINKLPTPGPPSGRRYSPKVKVKS